MPKQTKKRDTGCPIAFALDTFGDRWSLLVIRDMAFKGFQSYNQFLNSEEKIATNVLADRLAELEELGIISKLTDPADGRRHLYVLTSKGIALLPVLIEMMQWSAQYDVNTIVKPEILSRIVHDREAFITQLREKIINRQALLTPMSRA